MWTFGSKYVISLMKAHDPSEKLLIGGVRNDLIRADLSACGSPEVVTADGSASKFQSKINIQKILRRSNLKPTSATWQGNGSGGSRCCLLVSSERFVRSGRPGYINQDGHDEYRHSTCNPKFYTLDSCGFRFPSFALPPFRVRLAMLPTLRDTKYPESAFH